MIYSAPQGGLPGLVREPRRAHESRLVNLWLSLVPGTVLLDTRNRPILILDPGRRNRNEGPDVREARLYLEGRLQEGAVECHLTADQWYRHGHASDPRYHEVILHVLQRDSGQRHRLERPVILLDPDFTPPLRCDLSTTVLASDYPARLQDLAAKRWQAHLCSFLQASDPDQHLLKTSLRLLGIGGNEAAFEALAAQVDPTRLARLEEQVVLEAVKRAAARVPETWHRCGLRPSQHPQQRFPLAAVIIRFLGRWDATYCTRPERFRRAFEDQFQSRFGQGICTELLGNAFYPCLAAEGLQRGRWVSTWRKAWERLRLPYSYGVFQRRFAAVLPDRLLKSFSALQGLKLLDEGFCRKNFCLLCPLKDRHGGLD